MSNKLLDKYKGMPVQAKVVFWFTVVGFLQRGVSVITTPLFTRILTTEQYGMFSVYTAWSEIIAIFVTLNLHMAVMNNAFMKTGTTKERVVSSFQGLSFLTGLLWLVLYFLLRRQFINIIRLPDIVITAMFISFLFLPPYHYWVIYKRYQYDYKKMAVVSCGVTLLTPIASLAAIAFAGDDFKGEARILGKIVVLCGTGLFFAVINWRKDHTFLDRKLWKYALVFNLPLIPHFLSETILNQSDRIMINTFSGMSEAGVYNIAYSAASLVLIFSSAINTALVPWQYEKLKQKEYSRIASVTNSILLGLEIVIVIMIMLAPEIIMVLAGEKYIGAVRLIPTLAASVFFNYLYQTFARVEMYYGKRIYTVIATLSATVLNIGLNYLLIPKFSYVAAGYTTLIAHIVLCLMHYLFYKKVCHDYMADMKAFMPGVILLFSIAILIIASLITFLYSYYFLRIILLCIALVFLLALRKKITSLLKSVLQERR